MKIVVIGAGYAGTLAANRITKKIKTAEVTVINPRPNFVERVRLHQHIAETAVVATPLTSMLKDGIATQVGAVDKIGDGTVALDDHRIVDFDYAFLAVGSTVVPMLGTVPVGTWEGAEQARTALAVLPAGSVVTIIGGGPTGIETVAEIAGARPDIQVTLVGSVVAASFTDGAHQRVRAGLERLEVDILDDEVTEVAPGTGQYDGIVHRQSGAAYSSDLILWAIVAGIPDLAARSGLAVNAQGRVIVDEFLRSVTDNRVFAVGDCAAVPGARLACYTAQPQAMRAVDTLDRLINGRAPKPYSMPYVARAVTLGRKDAVGQFTHGDDTPRRVYISGRTAVAAKEMASRGGKFNARNGGF